MQTIAVNSARIALDRTSVMLKLPELEYLMLNLTALSNQLARYKLAETDVSVYVQSGSDYFRSSRKIGVSFCAI